MDPYELAVVDGAIYSGEWARCVLFPISCVLFILVIIGTATAIHFEKYGIVLKKTDNIEKTLKLHKWVTNTMAAIPTIVFITFLFISAIISPRFIINEPWDMTLTRSTVATSIDTTERNGIDYFEVVNNADGYTQYLIQMNKTTVERADTDAITVETYSLHREWFKIYYQDTVRYQIYIPRDYVIE